MCLSDNLTFLKSLALLLVSYGESKISQQIADHSNKSLEILRKKIAKEGLYIRLSRLPSSQHLTNCFASFSMPFMNSLKFDVTESKKSINWSERSLMIISSSENGRSSGRFIYSDISVSSSSFSFIPLILRIIDRLNRSQGVSYPVSDELPKNTKKKIISVV